MPESLRIVLVSTIVPVLEFLVPVLRDLGHEPVAVVGARSGRSAPPWGELANSTAPAGIAVLLPAGKHEVAGLLRAYEPDLVLSWGYPWKLPQEALDVPRLGAVNHHPALLPRHRGPVPMAWALREGDAELGITWHRMDAELDTGAILAQATVPIEDDDSSIEQIGPKLAVPALGLLPGVLERVLAGDPGDPQDDSQATWAGHFGEDYATVDWTQPARSVHNQVRAWALTFGLSDLVAPVAELDGERVRLLRTSLRDPGSGARRVECGDGPLWILESEPVEGVSSA